MRLQAAVLHSRMAGQHRENLRMRKVFQAEQVELEMDSDLHSELKQLGY